LIARIGRATVVAKSTSGGTAVKLLYWARAIWGGAAILTCTGVSHATILTFDETRNATGVDVIPTVAGATMQQDYGDYVSGSPMSVSGGEFTYGEAGEGFTPNVGVDYFTETGRPIAQWTTGYGDLINVLFASTLGGAANSLYVSLSADLDFLVQLYQFDLAAWSGTDYVIDGVTVSSEAGILFSQANVLVEGDVSGPRRTTFGFADPLIGQELLIAIDFSNMLAGLQDNIGLDNVRFGQTGLADASGPPTTVPAPESLGLMALGLLGLCWVRSTRTPRENSPR
jgi:hypothetical protein